MTDPNMTKVSAHPLTVASAVPAVLLPATSAAGPWAWKGLRLLHILGCLLLSLTLSGCWAATPVEKVGVGITGIDHLADHLSVQNFWIDGHNAFQAGKGGRTACCAMVPARWHEGLKVRVRWNVTNWRDRTSESFEREVPVDRYQETGQMFVHFLADGSVRVLLSDYYPEGDKYPGPRGIPRKFPWKVYPWVDDPSPASTPR